MTADDASKLIDGVTQAFRPLWDEQNRRLSDLERTVSNLAESEFHRPQPPMNLQQFAQDILAVLGLHDSVGHAALRERAAAIDAMCRQVTG